MALINSKPQKKVFKISRRRSSFFDLGKLAKYSKKLVSVKNSFIKFLKKNERFNNTVTLLQTHWRKLNPKLQAFIMLFLIFVPTFVLLTTLSPQQVEAAWYDQTFGFRQRVDLTNSSGSNLTNFQVSINLDTSALVTAGKLQSDCDDIRITDNKGKVLPHWIESGSNGCNTSSTNIWTKVPTLFTSGTSIYLYYGNPEVSNSANGNLVFEVFADFATGSSLPTGWIKTDIGTSGTAAVGSGVLTITNTNGSDVYDNNYQATQVYNNTAFNGNFIAETEIVSQSNSDVWAKTGISVQNSVAPATSNGHAFVATTPAQGIIFQHQATNLNTAPNANSQGGVYTFPTHLRMVKSGSNLSGYWSNNGTTFTQQGSTVSPTGISTNQYISLFITPHNVAATGTATYKFFFVRKHASTEPTNIKATEEVGPGPVAEWSFDEGQGQVVQDGTRNNNDGVLGANSGSSTDDPTWQSEDMCVSGKCLRFDGMNDQVTLNTLPDINSPYSVEFWFKPQELGRAQSIFSTKGAGSYPKIWMNANNKLLVYSGAEKYIYSGKTFIADDLNKWWHITAVIDDTTNLNTWKLYVNGIESHTNGANTGTYFDPSTSGSIGGEITLNFKGGMDEIKVYPYVRSSTQTKEAFNQGASVLGANNDKAYLSDGLVGYWKMDEASWNNNCSTDNVLDSSGNNNHGDSCPNTTGPTGGLAGRFGNGGSFDGVDDYITVPSGSTSLLSQLSSTTVSIWVNPTTTAVTQGLIGKQNGSRYSYGIWIISTGFTVMIRNSDQSVLTECNYTGGSLPVNTWSHISGTIQSSGTGSTLTAYLNGVAVTSCTSAATLGGGIQPVFIGATSIGANLLNGRLDEARIYNRALSASEVSDLYNWAPGPLAHWRMDDNVGGNAQTLLDSSTNGLNATTDDGANNTGMNCTVVGKQNGACLFDGVDDYATASSTNFAPNKSWSISSWINANSLTLDGSTSRVVLAQQDGTGTGRGLLYVDNATSRPTSFLGNTPTYGASALNLNTWYHISVVYNSATSQVTIYTNGVAGTPNIVTAEAASGSFVLGASKVLTGRWSGLIDETKVYNYALTQTQILSDMESSVAGTSVGVVLPEPLAHYKFDEQGGQTVNNSGIGGSSLNGTLGAGSGAGTDDPTWRNKETCRTNSCLDFDKVDDYIALPTLSTVTGSGTSTFSAFINIPDSTNANGTVIQNVLASSDRLVLGVNGTTVTYSYYNGTAWTSKSGSIATNTWYHIAGSNQNGTLSLYINGVLQTGTTQGFAGSGIATRIGSTTFSTSNNFRGNIDEVKIYNTALTANQIKLDYNAGTSLNFGSTSVSEASILNGGAGATPNIQLNLDEKTGSTAKDTSGNNLTATINGASWTQGKEGAGLRFDGTDDYTTTADSAALNQTTISLETWVKFNTVNGTNKTIVAKWQPGVKQQYVLQLDSDNKLAFWTGDGTTGGSRLASALTPVANTWYHIVATASGSNKAIYINGRLDASTTSGYALTGSSDIDFSLGSKKNGSGTYFEFLDGTIDQVKLYNYVRSQAQIAYNYNRGAPVAHYKFDECQGNVANDSSGNGNSGTFSIGASGTQTSAGTCNTSGTVWGNGATGKFNSSLNFDGMDDYVTLSDTPSLAITGSLTMSAWIKPSAFPYTANAIAGRWGGAGQKIYKIAVLNSGKFYIDVTGIGSGDNYRLSQTTLIPNNWYHVVGVYTSGASPTLDVYINGVLDNASVVGTIPTSLSANSAPFNIGADSNTGSNPFSGLIDDVRVYNYALTADQIKQVMNGGAVRFGPNTGTP